MINSSVNPSVFSLTGIYSIDIKNVNANPTKESITPKERKFKLAIKKEIPLLIFVLTPI